MTRFLAELLQKKATLRLPFRFCMAAPVTVPEIRVKQRVWQILHSALLPL